MEVGARHDGLCDPLAMVIGRRTDSQKRTIQVLEDLNKSFPSAMDFGSFIKILVIFLWSK